MEHIDSEPDQPTVLTQQATHRSTRVLEFLDEAIVIWLHRAERWRSLVSLSDVRVLGYLLTAGLYGVSQLHFMQVDTHLVCALVEWWRREPHTFHLFVGETTITLQDVEVLLGLLVQGLPVLDDGDLISTLEIPGRSLVYLGFTPTNVRGMCILMTEIQTHLTGHPLHENSPDVDVQQ